MSDPFPRRLSDPAVRNAKPAAKPVKKPDGGGLYLLVQPNGAKLWRYKFRLNGREGLLAIGAYPDVPLTLARERHREARANVAAGISPVQARRKSAAEEGEFAAVLLDWRKLTDAGLALNTFEQRERECKKHLLPAWPGRQIRTITRAEIAAVLRRLDDKTPEVARNVRSYISAIFEHAIGLGLADANPTPPARVMKRRRQQAHAAMDPARLPEFLQMLDKSTIEPATNIALRLVLLTACRKAEICGGQWCEVDLEAGTWIIPAERMKARREHWVPLSRQAHTLLRELRRLSNGELMFPNRRDADRPMAERTLNAVLQRSGFEGETIHGFRSVFSTHFNALPGTNPEVVERCLAHAPADKVRAVYNRHPYQIERRAMLQQWADYLESVSCISP